MKIGGENMLASENINIKWNKANKKYFQQLGYVFTRCGEEFNISTLDLLPNSSVKVVAICDFCKKEYEVAWKKYINIENKNQKHACYNCRHVKRYENDLNKRQHNLYLKALEACKTNGYTLISNEFEILCNTSYIRYSCPQHGEHSMRISNFISGKGCPDCVSQNNSERFRLSPDEVERRIQECGGKLLNKKDYINQAEKNLLVECLECSKPFFTSLRLFTQHGGQVCEDCSGSESIGEKRIRHYLENKEINFICQKWFPDCRDTNPLPFDFYVPDYNVIVEFDGRQHFGETNYFTYSFEETKRHDEIKNNYCKANGIYLIRIPYWNIDKIEQILDNELILHEDIV